MPPLFLSIQGFGCLVISFFCLLQYCIDFFCPVSPPGIAEKGFTADGIPAECRGIDGVCLRAGKGMEGIVAQDVHKNFFKCWDANPARDFNGSLAHLRCDNNQFPAGGNPGKKAPLRILEDERVRQVFKGVGDRTSRKAFRPHDGRAEIGDVMHQGQDGVRVPDTCL